MKMTLKTTLTTTVLMMSTLCAGLAMAADKTPAVFTPEQEARIGQIAADYLVAHPEILVQVSQKLQAQQQARQQQMMAARVMDNQDALLNNPDTPVTGPKTATVAVIEFFDYQCVFCSRLAPELEKVMQARPDVRYVFKDWPIFAGRWKASQDAAERGLAIWKQDGAAAYLTYHNGVFHSGHNEGALTQADIDNATRAAVKEAGVKPADVGSLLDGTNALAQKLGLTGTPGLIVMPVASPTPDTITVLPGAVPAAQIEAAIDRAKGVVKNHN